MCCSLLNRSGAARGRWVAGLITAALATAGCGGSDMLEVYPTKGTLTIDSEPFGPTSIMLVPTQEKIPGTDEPTHSAVGQVDQTGAIKFTTYDPGDGVPAGEYRVVVGMDFAEPPKPFPKVYRDSQKGPLLVKVEPGVENDLKIVMDSKAGPPVPKMGFGKGPDMGEAMESPAFSAGATKDE